MRSSDTMLPPVRAVFQCQELLEAIFNQLSTGMVHHEDTPEDVKERTDLRRTLASASRVCHCFAEVALNKLWCALDNLIPLLRLLPNIKRNENSVYVISGGSTNSSWTRVQVHANRVRGLCHYPNSFEAVHSSVWSALVLRCLGSPFLPNLRVLDVDRVTPSDIALLYLVLSPSLRELYLSLRSDPPPPEGPIAQDTLSSLSGILMESISNIAPDLTVLYLETHFPVPSRSLQALKRLTRLKEFKLCDSEATVDTTALRAISTLQSLRVLFLEDVHLADTTGDLDLDDGLQNIETLYMHAHPLDLLRVVRASRFAVLTHLDFMIHCAGGIDPVGPLSSLATHLPPTVRILRLGFCDGTSASPPALPLGDVLQALRPLAGLTDIGIDTGAQRLSAADGDVRVLAELWPRLRRFLLADDEERPRELAGPHPTFAALVELAGRCKELESLALPCLDTAGLPPSEQIAAMSHGLRWLGLDWVVGETAPSEVADAVHRLFPTLTLDDLPEGSSKQREGAKEWLPIREHLKTLQGPKVE